MSTGMKTDDGKPTQIGTTYSNNEVSYSTKGHTNELVHLSIMGQMAGALSPREGDEYPNTRILNNTVLHSFMLRAACL